jgi:hypothetical protein
LRAAFNRRGAGTPYQEKKNLKVLFECRPYELGWLLYAFAARTGQCAPALAEKHSNPMAIGHGVLSGKN